MERSYEKEKDEVEERNNRSEEKGKMKGFWISSNTQGDATKNGKKLLTNSHTNVHTNWRNDHNGIFIHHSTFTFMPAVPYQKPFSGSWYFPTFNYITVSHVCNFPYYVTIQKHCNRPKNSKPCRRKREKNGNDDDDDDGTKYRNEKRESERIPRMRNSC